MDLTQLKMFCAVADCGSMARAAQQLHRVPSNLTTRLRQLEEELGGNLFIREKQRLRLSPMGHNFLCYARRILLLSEEALSMTQASQPGGISLLAQRKARRPRACLCCWPSFTGVIRQSGWRWLPAHRAS